VTIGGTRTQGFDMPGVCFNKKNKKIKPLSCCVCVHRFSVSAAQQSALTDCFGAEQSLKCHRNGKT